MILATNPELVGYAVQKACIPPAMFSSQDGGLTWLLVEAKLCDMMHDGSGWPHATVPRGRGSSVPISTSTAYCVAPWP